MAKTTKRMLGAGPALAFLLLAASGVAGQVFVNGNEGDLPADFSAEVASLQLNDLLNEANQPPQGMPMGMFGGSIWNPLDHWMEKQMDAMTELQSILFDSRAVFPTLEPMPRLPTRPFMQMGGPGFVDMDFEEADTDFCLHALARQRLPIAMREMDSFFSQDAEEELMGPTETVSWTDEDGASWTKTSGGTSDGSSWMSFTLSNEPESHQDFAEAFLSTIASSQEIFRRSQEQMEMQPVEIFQEEVAEANPSPPDHHHHHHHKHHLACVAAAAGLAALLSLGLSWCCLRAPCSRGAAYPYPCAKEAALDEPLLPQGKKELTGNVVVASEYVNLAYVPLKGEEDV